MALANSLWVKFAAEDAVLVTYLGTQYRLTYQTVDSTDGWWGAVTGDLTDGTALLVFPGSPDLQGTLAAEQVDLYTIAAGVATFTSTPGFVDLDNWTITGVYDAITAASIVRPPAAQSTIAWTAGSTRNNFDAKVGYQFVAARNQTVLRVGRRKITGNTQTHNVGIYDASFVNLGSKNIDSTATADADGIIWLDLDTPITLTAGTTYYAMVREYGAGDSWYEDNQTFTAGAYVSSIKSSYEIGGSFFLAGGGSGKMFTSPMFQSREDRLPLFIELSLYGPPESQYYSVIAGTIDGAVEPVSIMNISTGLFEPDLGDNDFFVNLTGFTAQYPVIWSPITNTGTTTCPFVEWIGELTTTEIFIASDTWEPPVNVDTTTPVIVEAWGPGGNGASDVTDAGGGGGAYAASDIATEFPLSVPAAIIDILDGDGTYFNAGMVVAVAGNASGQSAAGDAASSVGQVKFSGGAGGDADGGVSGGGGGSAYSCTDGEAAALTVAGSGYAYGGEGQAASNTNGLPGDAPGGGGSGGNGSGLGGAGGHGELRIHYRTTLIDTSYYSASASASVSLSDYTPSEPEPGPQPEPSVSGPVQRTIGNAVPRRGKLIIGTSGNMYG